MEIQKLTAEIIAFRDQRGWAPFHSPAHLAMSISIEAAELLENYQWGEQYADAQNVQEELADVMIYALQMADALQLDVAEIIRAKMEKNALKYPLPKADEDHSC